MDAFNLGLTNIYSYYIYYNICTYIHGASENVVSVYFEGDTESVPVVRGTSNPISAVWRQPISRGTGVVCTNQEYVQPGVCPTWSMSNLEYILNRSI
jgi:hypothetical protein